ncbi:MAG: tRNA uridine-5-carboxymethylaminomethyl(34) synthesis GTPase MnmE [Clostridiales bacterium]|nr:tRNA uridine-5-carboxymethylaminomethyl(34) synthesis GTPase MnmE [Clostridiales bacterium]
MTDTIAAVSTAPGLSGIGVVRMSGSGALGVLENIFRPRGNRTISDLASRRAHLGHALGTGREAIDECLCIIFRAPNSYTGENLVELQCHGSPTVLGEVLRAACMWGARPAMPGEFTKRAFLNGRLDLAQAESVIDIIEAETLCAAKAATAQLHGSVSRIIERSYGDLLDISAHFHAVIDYPDEDIEDFRPGEYAFKLRRLEEALAGLLETFERGYVLKNGFLTTIIGRPNVGKSSLLNALLGYDRAIVTANPGTTRDTIEEKLVLGDTLLRLVDTAGIRSTSDEAESEGVTRALRAAEDAELVIAVFDGSENLTREDERTIAAASDAKRAVAVINKRDLPQKLRESDLGDGFTAIVHVCAKQSEGLDELAKAVAELTGGMSVTGAGGILTNARQADCVSRTLEYVKEASEALGRGVTPDAALVEIEGALEMLGEILGRNIREDTVDRIFSRFCVGK